MTAADLLARAKAAGLTMWREGDRLKYRGPLSVIEAILPDLRMHKAELLGMLPGDPAAEARRQQAVELLARNPMARIAAITNAEADKEAVLLTVAIRDVGSCELHIPREKWDGCLFLDLLERHGATVH